MIDERAEVLGAYGITDALVTPLDVHGSTSVALVVQPGGAELMLKQVAVTSGGTVALLAEQFALLDHLAAAGLPVAVPLTTINGEPFVEIGASVFVLTPRLVPRDAGLPDGAAAWAGVGRCIATLHAELAVSEIDRAGWTMDLPRQLRDELWPTLDAAPHEVGVLDDPADRVALATALDGFGSQRLHGDLHGGNLLLDRLGVYGVVDFDELPIGPRVNDLGYYAADLAKNRAQLAGSGDGGGGGCDPSDFVVDVIGWVIAGYRAASGLSRRESAAVVASMIVSELRLLAWFCAPGDDLAEWTTHQGTLAWIVDHRSALEATVGE